MAKLRRSDPVLGAKTAIACDELDLGQPIPDSVPVRRTFGFLLQDTSRLVRRRFIQLARAAELPINRSEASVLLHVDHQQGINQTNLAGALDIEPISLVRLLDRLEALGLIERRRHPTDRRVWTIWLTDASGPLLDRVRAITLQVRDQAFAGFAETRRTAFIEELGALHANLLRSPGGAES